MKTKAEILNLIKPDDTVPIEAYEYYAATKDRDVRNALIMANDNLVGYTLNKYNYNFFDSNEDVLQNGRIGLIYAVENFDPGKGTAFSTFAIPYIRGYAIRLRDRENAAGCNPNILNFARKISQFDAENPGSNTFDVAKEFGVKEHEVCNARNVNKILGAVSLSVPISEEESLTLMDAVEDDGPRIECLVEREIIRKDMLRIMKDIVTDIHDSSWDIIERVFGLNGFPQMSQAEISKEFGCCRSNAWGIKQNFIKKMRHPDNRIAFRNAMGIPFDVPSDQIADYLFKEEE